MDLEVCSGKKAISNLPELPNTMFLVVIRWVSNVNDIVQSPKQLHTLYTDVQEWKELSDFIDKNWGPKEPYILQSLLKHSLVQDKLDNE